MIHVRPKSHTARARTKAKTFEYYSGPPPDLDRPEDWFYFTDIDHNGSLSQEEVITSISAKLRANPKQRMMIRENIQGSWKKFDRNNDMRVTKREFLSSGMVGYLKKLEKDFAEAFSNKNKKPLKIKKNRLASEGTPSVSSGKVWFDYFDTNKNDVLSVDEVVGALIESLHIHSETEEDVIKDTIANCWVVFDIDLSRDIDKWEFLVEGGLKDYLLLLEKEWKERPEDRNTYKFLNLYVKGSRRHPLSAPPSLSDPLEWFEHFDYDYTGKLSQKEAIDGLIVTLNANTSAKRRTIRETIVEAWERCDTDSDNYINKDEFLASDGLASVFSTIELDDEAEKKSELEMVEIIVNVPKDKGSGEIMLVSSPTNQEMVMVMIPDKVKWSGGGDGPFYFKVLF